jgi:serine protease Do
MLNRKATGSLLAVGLGLWFGWVWMAPETRAATKDPARPLAPPSVTETASLETLTASALKSLVVISHTDREGNEAGVGAGFIISRDGLIATSLHVIGEARPITVRLASGRRYSATAVQAWDRNFDLAIIQIDATDLPALPLGDSDTLKQGAPVIALGNPLGLERSVVQGIVSARREVEGSEMIQIAIPIEPGNSGGPLLDLKGRVQGILTLKSALTANLGFATPVNLLKALRDKPNRVPINRWLTIGALNPKDWATVMGGRWSQKTGRIRVEEEGEGFGGRALCLWQNKLPPRPYEVAVSVKLDDESGAAGLVFGSDGNDQHYGFYPSAGQLRLTRFEGPNVFQWTILKQQSIPAYRRGEWNHLRIRLEAEKILCYINGHLAIESRDDVLPDGQVGLAKFRDTRAEFKHFQVGTNLTLPPASPALADALQRRISEAGAAPDPGLLAELEAQGPAGAHALKTQAEQLEIRARQLRRLAADLHGQQVQAELVRTLDQPEEKIDLARAALLIAKLDNEDLDIDLYREQISVMAREIRSNLPAAAGPTEKLTALKAYLFVDNGFHGSRSDYYNRANSYLSAVLDDREGLPITLAVLFLELAQRIGLDGVAGLPLPGHFMVKFTPKTGTDEIIDVFDGGRTVGRTEAQQRVFEVTGQGFRDSDYKIATKREIVIRMLNNLLGIAQRSDAVVDGARYLNVLLALSPDSATHRLQRAQLRLRNRDLPGAKEDFKWLLDHPPEEMNLDRIAELYRSL